MATYVIGPFQIAGIGLGWFLWISMFAPFMWRWHVSLPRAHRALEAEPDSCRKRRDLRRINLQLAHFGARRSGKVVFVVITLIMLVSTLMIFLIPMFYTP